MLQPTEPGDVAAGRSARLGFAVTSNAAMAIISMPKIVLFTRQTRCVFYEAFRPRSAAGYQSTPAGFSPS
jgi:hypothetical protein